MNFFFTQHSMAGALTPERRKFLELIQPLPEKTREILLGFFEHYAKAVLAGGGKLAALELYVSSVLQLHEHPFTFAPYHQKLRHPFDYYQLGLDFMRPLIDLTRSRLFGKEQIEKILKQLGKKENVILLANHQTEPDPQIISLLLEKEYPTLAEQVIYVAGERVVTELLAIPLSMGCDLLCIYSKRYIDHPPELKTKKQLHNKNTMELMRRLLEEGGKIIYVAPSGGRDRKNEQGKVEVARFDANSIEMFYLMAKKAKTPTHFYPFALSTYDLMPPPSAIQVELGESRQANRSAAWIDFLPEFDMEHFPGSDEEEKALKRTQRADAIWKIVKNTYEKHNG